MLMIFLILISELIHIYNSYNLIIRQEELKQLTENMREDVFPDAL